MLVVIRPTAGVDVRSKEFLLRRIRQVADGGKAALIVSDELDDLRVCDRVLVMFHGRVVAEFDRGWSDEHAGRRHGRRHRRHGPRHRVRPHPRGHPPPRDADEHGR